MYNLHMQPIVGYNSNSLLRRYYSNYNFCYIYIYIFVHFQFTPIKVFELIQHGNISRIHQNAYIILYMLIHVHLFFDRGCTIKQTNHL